MDDVNLLINKFINIKYIKKLLWIDSYILKRRYPIIGIRIASAWTLSWN